MLIAYKAWRSSEFDTEILLISDFHSPLLLPSLDILLNFLRYCSVDGGLTGGEDVDAACFSPACTDTPPPNRPPPTTILMDGKVN